MEGGKGDSLFTADKMTKVLIVYKTTGGGHKASAQALKDAFDEKYGRKIEVSMLDVLPLCAPPFNKSDMYYDFMVKHPFLWRGAFAWSSTRWGERVGMAWYKVGFVDNLKKLFAATTPDLVVSVHPLLQVPCLAAIKAFRDQYKQPKRIPFATVVTDYTTCHATWFEKGVDKCFVPTVETKEFGERRGLTASQLVMHGLPIRPAFSKLNQSKAKLRQKLKIKKAPNTVLVVGGGDGMGPVEETCVALDKRFKGDGQIVVICGRNKKLVSKLNRKKYTSNVVVLGFVSNMHEWMAASDCIITKAGPGTIAESLACGLPIMLNNFIPCQEAGNIPWVIDNGVGDYSNEPEEVANTVLNWIRDKEGLRKMRRKALALGRPGATYEIVDDLVELIRRYRWEPFKQGAVNNDIKEFATVPSI
jgi:1,2-diacylglycerol 3-beta-galactosyltransferase